MRVPLAGLVRYGALTILGVLCIGPIAVMVLTSFKTQAQTFTMGLNFLFVPTLENYRDVLFDASFGRYLVNSLIVGIVATLITLLLGCMAAYGMARFSFAGRKALAYTTLMLRTVPLAVIAVPVFMIWSDWKLTNSLAGPDPALRRRQPAVHDLAAVRLRAAGAGRARGGGGDRRLPAVEGVPAHRAAADPARASPPRRSSPSASPGTSSSWRWC